MAGFKNRCEKNDRPATSGFEPEGDKNVLAVAIGKDGNIWFSTSRGLFRHAEKNGATLTTSPLAGTLLMNKKVISLFADSDGFIWAGFYGQGAVRINPENGTIKISALNYSMGMW